MVSHFADSRLIKNFSSFSTNSHLSGFFCKGRNEGHEKARIPILHLLLIIVLKTDDTFRLYYTAISAANPSVHCIGVASSGSVQGPYQPEANALACADS